MKKIETPNIKFYNTDSLNLYKTLPKPIVIISDGPYGVSGYPGDLKSANGLGDWYKEHIAQWNKYATAQTTLWFWNTELGWANVHPELEKQGWEYKACHVWNKGIAHKAGNINMKTSKTLPVVTEICVQYVKKPIFDYSNKKISMKEWLYNEWKRTGLPFSKTNIACNVKDAATRKYFTQSYLWYMPPAEAFEKIVNYANKYGSQQNRPFFSIDGKKSLSKKEWEQFRAKFYCPLGITNVWDYPALRGEERIKIKHKAIHLNQKPLKLIESIIRISSDEGDVIWDPFGGLATSSIASQNINRLCYSAEINADIFEHAKKRIEKYLKQAS
jgi:site-specific DNA-methyltransferase (adenine-specific)